MLQPRAWSQSSLSSYSNVALGVGMLVLARLYEKYTSSDPTQNPYETPPTQSRQVNTSVSRIGEMLSMLLHTNNGWGREWKNFGRYMARRWPVVHLSHILDLTRNRAVFMWRSSSMFGTSRLNALRRVSISMYLRFLQWSYHAAGWTNEAGYALWYQPYGRSAIDEALPFTVVTSGISYAEGHRCNQLSSLRLDCAKDLSDCTAFDSLARCGKDTYSSPAYHFPPTVFSPSLIVWSAHRKGVLEVVLAFALCSTGLSLYSGIVLHQDNPEYGFSS
jgi:hypothetical protein